MKSIILSLASLLFSVSVSAQMSPIKKELVCSSEGDNVEGYTVNVTFDWSTNVRMAKVQSYCLVCAALPPPPMVFPVVYDYDRSSFTASWNNAERNFSIEASVPDFLPMPPGVEPKTMTMAIQATMKMGSFEEKLLCNYEL